MNDQTKPWWASRTILAAAGIVVANVAASFGLEIGSEALTETLVQIANVALAIIAANGRIAANARIK